jgi:hypothetical protein
MSCLEELASSEKRWKYVFTLNSHDIQIKTNAEAIQIFKWLDGANSIEFEFKHVGPQKSIKDMHTKYDWSFANLRLFKNGNLIKKY